MISIKKINSNNIYLISDIHANLNLFKKAIKDIDLDKEYLFILGDLFEKGNLNIKTLDYLMDLKERYPNNLFMIRGNCDNVLKEFYYPRDKEKLKRYSLVLKKTILNEFLEGIGININSSYDLDKALDLVIIKYKKYFDFVNNLDEGYFINEKILLTHADLDESIKKSIILKEEFNKFKYKLNVVGHMPVMMYKDSPNMDPLKIKDVLYIDGGNNVVEFGGLNLVKLDLDTLNYTFTTFYNYRLAYVIKDIEGSGNIYIPKKTKVDKFELINDFYKVYINEKLLYVTKNNLINNSYCYDASNIFLSLNKNDLVNVAYMGKDISIIIKNNNAGFVYTKYLKMLN